MIFAHTLLRNIIYSIAALSVFLFAVPVASAEDPVLTWINPESLAVFDVSDSIVADGTWDLAVGEIAIYTVYIDSVKREDLWIVPSGSDTTGTFSSSAYSAFALGSGDHTISITEKRTTLADCPSPSECIGTASVWPARTFTINPAPDPLFTVSITGTGIDFSNVGISDPPATATFEIQNVGSDMAPGTYNIAVQNLGTPGVYSCIEVGDSVCSYSAIPSGGVATVTIQFDPTVVLHEDGIVGLPLGGALPNQEIDLDGDGVVAVGPYLSVELWGLSGGASGDVGYHDEGSPAFAMQFPNLYTGDTTGNDDSDLSIWNLGTETLNGTVSGLETQDDFLGQDGQHITWSGADYKSIGSYSISPGGYASLDITFTPQADGMRFAQLIFTNDDTGEVVIFDVSGLGIDAPILDVDDTLTNGIYDFGNVMYGETLRLPQRIQNKGGNTLTSDTTVTSAGGHFNGRYFGVPGAVSMITDLEHSEQYFADDEWAVDYSPLTLASHTGTIEYDSNGGPITTRTLTGQGLELILASLDTATATVAYEFGSYLTGGGNYVINYGDVLLGSTATGTFTVSNAAIASGPINGDYTINDPLSEFTYPTPPGNAVNLLVGASQNIQIEFTPDAINGLGARSATVTFNGLPDHPLGAVTFELRANVVAPQIDVQPTSHIYAPTRVGASTTKVFRVENIGSGTLNGTLTFAGAGVFRCAPEYEINQSKTLDSFGPDWVTGVSGTALNLRNEDGINDYVEVPHNDDGSATDLVIDGDEVTLSAWVRLNDEPLDDIGIVLKNDGSYDLHLGVQEAGMPSFRLKAIGETQLQINAGPKLVEGRWYHLAGVYDGAYASIYVDGEFVGKHAYSGSLHTNTKSLLIGRRTDNRYLDGSIDEVRVYGRAVTFDEIQALKDLSGEPSSGLVAYYSFDAGSGDAIVDDTGNGNNGYIVYRDTPEALSSGFTRTYSNGIGSFQVDGLGETDLEYDAPNELFEWIVDKKRSEVDPSLDNLQIRYKNYINGPASTTMYFIDNADCVSYEGACSQTFDLVNTDTAWHTLDTKVTNEYWTDYNASVGSYTDGYERPAYFLFDFTKHTALGTMEFDFIRFSQDTLIAPGCAFELQGNEARYIPVTFEPTAAGVFSGSVTFDGGAGSMQTVPLSGIGLADTGGLLVTPLEHDFGSVVVGQEQTQEYLISNTSDATISGEILDAVPRALTSSGDGLLASYYTNDTGNFTPNTKSALIQWIDPTVDHDWGPTAPLTGFDNNEFAIVWRGKIEAPETGSVIFTLGDPIGGRTVDDLMRLHINGTLIGNCNSSICALPAVDMVAGHFYDIRVEIVEDWSDARAFLYWQPPSAGAPAVVPQASLYTDDYFESLDFGGPSDTGGASTTAPYSCDGVCTYSIAPGSSVVKTLRFSPTTDVTYDRHLYFSGMHGHSGFVTGVGSFEPVIQVEVIDATGSVIALCSENPADTQCNTITVDYGEVNVGTPTSTTFRITNIGQSLLDGFGDVLANDAYQYTTDVNYSGLPNGASDDITIVFNPDPLDASTNPQDQTLTFHNSAISPPTSVSLNLTGTAVYEPIFTLNDAVLDFGPVRVNDSLTKTFRLRNTGRDLLTDTFSAPGAPFACDYYEEYEEVPLGSDNWVKISGPTADCTVPFSIARNEAVYITLTFTPTAVQNYSGIISLTSIPQVQLPLAGEGISLITDFIFEER